MTPRITTRPAFGALLLTAALALCACGDTSDATTSDATNETTAPPDASPGGRVATTASPETDSPIVATTPAGGTDVVGAELVCPAVLDTLALAADAGWAPGAGLQDEAVAASISAQLVIALVLDDPGQTQSLWDAVDAIADEGCPTEADQLTAIYGSTDLRDILAAS